MVVWVFKFQEVSWLYEGYVLCHILLWTNAFLWSEHLSDVMTTWILLKQNTYLLPDVNKLIHVNKTPNSYYESMSAEDHLSVLDVPVLILWTHKFSSTEHSLNMNTWINVTRGHPCMDVMNTWIHVCRTTPTCGGRPCSDDMNTWIILTEHLPVEVVPVLMLLWTHESMSAGEHLPVEDVPVPGGLCQRWVLRWHRPGAHGGVQGPHPDQARLRQHPQGVCPQDVRRGGRLGVSRVPSSGGLVVKLLPTLWSFFTFDGEVR